MTTMTAPTSTAEVPWYRRPEHVKRARVERELGRPRLVPVGPARARVRELTEAGWTFLALAEAAGLCESTVRKLAGCPARTMVKATTARKVLELEPAALYARANPSDWVPAVGTHRRVAALLAMAWPHARMRAECGVATSVMLAQRRQWVTRATHDAVAAMYERLHMTPGPSQVARDRARAAGHAPPLAWDDIDDPAETPKVGAPPNTAGGGRAPALEEWVHLVRSGEGLERAAARCGVTLNAVERAAYRRGRTDVLRMLGIHTIRTSGLDGMAAS